MPQLDVATFPSLIFWLLVSFGILYLGLRYLVVPKLSETLEARFLKIKNHLKSAETLQKKAEEINHETEKKIQQARLDSQEHLSKTNSEILEFIHLKDQELSKKFYERHLALDKKIEMQRLKIESELKAHLKDIVKDVLERMSFNNISEDQIKDIIKGKRL